jgi:uracil-DNA glycosylase
VRVVILGQDPYPTPGHAHGLSFSVLPGVRLPGSLRNIVRELTDDLGIPRPDHGHLVAWARQGVFLLNCVLTVEAGKPGSHRGRGWEEFTDGVLRKLSATGPRKVFLLWGNDARKKAGLIDGDRHCVLESAHPSPLSAWQGFLGSRPFSKANQALISFGREPIDWRLPPLDQPA